MDYHCVTKPISFTKTHSRNNAEILCFIGGNPTDIQDFGAEVEISLGPEQEKHLITQTSCVSIPANLAHCPLDIKKVTKPIVFLEISLTPSYTPWLDLFAGGESSTSPFRYRLGLDTACRGSPDRFGLSQDQPPSTQRQCTGGFVFRENGLLCWGSISMGKIV